MTILAATPPSLVFFKPLIPQGDIFSDVFYSIYFARPSVLHWSSCLPLTFPVSCRCSLVMRVELIPPTHPPPTAPDLQLVSVRAVLLALFHTGCQRAAEVLKLLFRDAWKLSHAGTGCNKVKFSNQRVGSQPESVAACHLCLLHFFLCC